MTQPTERRFVMEPRLDAEVETLNTAISNEATARTNADALKVAKAGDTMTGALVLSGDPTLAMHAATKQYVDAGDAALQTSINDVKQTSRVYVKNGASSLTKGTPVYITGADGTNVIIGAASNASEATSSKVIGLTETDLTANAMGYVVTDGKLSNIDTSGAGAAGDAVWLGVNGAKVYGLANKPVAPAHMVYLGVVSRKNANTGEIEVKVQNGFELDELHNVLISSPANGQALTYDSATQLWKNATPASTLDALTDVTINSGTLSGGQVIKYDAGTTQWVNGAAAGGVTAAATAPNLATSAAGDAWFDTNDGTLYVCYVDVDSTKQWVQVQANSALEASILSRLGALESQSIAYGTQSPNYIINGGFDYLQRGQSYTITGSHFTHRTADRWILACTASGSTSITNSINAFPDGGVAVSGQDLRFFMRSNVTTVGTATAYGFINRVEDVRTLAGKTATLSFWVRGTQSTTITPYLIQYFGAGGSSDVTVNGTAQSVSTTWQRKTVTFTVPSVESKTINNADCFLQVQLNVNSVTTGTLDIAGVQLEAGSTATNFRRAGVTLQGELAACQRYYYRWSGSTYACAGSGLTTASTSSRVVVPLPVPMRIALSSISFSNLIFTDNLAYDATVTALTWQGTPSVPGTSAGMVVSHAAGAVANRPGLLQAANALNGVLEFSAEL